ncbi:MAG: GWxTD domain-containing protein [Ignavibacteriaceae bacterium]
MKKIILLITILPFAIISAQSSFNFNIDYASFKYDSSSNYLEFYYSFPSSQLKVERKGDNFQVEGIFHLELKNDSTGEYIVNKGWKIPSVVKDTAASARTSNLVGVIGFIVPKGKYTLSSEGSDFNNPGLKRSYKFPIIENPFGTKNMTVSGVQLAANIKQGEADKSSIFYKNTLEVIPRPSGIFGENLPVLFYYGEIYNLDKVPDLSSIKFVSSVYDGKGNLVYSHVKSSLSPSPASVEVGVINVSKYISGKYYLILSLSDSLKNESIISRKEFFVYNPTVKDTAASNVPSNTANVLSSQFAILSAEECDDIFAKSQYIASKNEKEQFRKIHTVEGKREFLYKFWNEKANEQEKDKRYVYTDYMNRVRVATDKYRNIARKGWQSDMGRVYIMYGEPSEIERHPNEGGKRPYEIWKYNDIEGGVQFIFGDLTGFRNYVLLSSTKRGEIQDDNWQQEISRVN